MPSDSPNYLKAAFVNAYNLSLLAGAAFASLATGDWLIGVAAAGVEALWLIGLLKECRARSQVVILDCCSGGAFATGAS